jgi:hypothetical protein
MEGGRQRQTKREEKEKEKGAAGGGERKRKREREKEKETNGVEDGRVDVRILCTNSHTTHSRRFPCPILRFFASMKDMILLSPPSCTHGPLFRAS